MIFIFLFLIFGALAIYGFATTQIMLAITAIIALIVTIAYKRDITNLHYYQDIIDTIEDVDKDAHRSPEFATLELSQKVVYLNAFRKGAKTIINKLKNNR